MTRSIWKRHECCQGIIESSGWPVWQSRGTQHISTWKASGQRE